MKPPKGTRLILADVELLDGWGTRTEDGYRIHAAWGKPDGNGWYTPTFTIDYEDSLAARLAVIYEDSLRATERRATVDRLRERLAANHNTLGAEFYRLDQIEALLDEEVAR